MKKLVLLLSLMVGNIALTFAQNDTVLYMANHPVDVEICLNRFDRVLVYGAENCQNYLWTVRLNSGYDQQPTGNPLIITGVYDDHYSIEYNGCGLWWDFNLHFTDDRWVPSSFTHVVWKHQGTPLTLEAVQPVGDSIYYDFFWSTGETTRTIEVSEPGTYTCTLPWMCDTGVRTFIVRDNVEIYRSSVDPATNKNRILWQTTPEQSAYISNVKVERDGMVVGTVPYTDGQFLDNIGSENAARVYRITGIAGDGTECPIPSYQFGTFNTIYSPDIANPNLMNFSWEDPFIEEGSPYEVVAYRIGKVDNAGEFVVIDQLSAQVHLGKYDMDLFNDSKRAYEELAFSNRSDNGIVGIEEDGPSTGSGTFVIYPNPAKDCVTIEGTGTLTVTNALGQTILTREIDGKETIELPQGLYFVKLDGTTRKIVVE
jgi:hypothetical protein